MQIWNDVAEVPDDWPACVVTVGVFDGVHRGHRELIRHAVTRAKVLGVPSAVLTFWPNPAEVVKPGDPPARICTLEQRLSLIEELGVDAALVLSFTEEFAQATPEFFAGSVLSDALAAAEVVVGENFRFGHRARGDVAMLESLGERLAFTVECVHLVTRDEAGTPISSSLIRKEIAAGDIAAASRALARPHRVEGTVVRGAGRGASLGFPTANLALTPFPALPPDGVYAGRLVLDPAGEARIVAAAVSVGTNPTFDEVIERRVEAWAYDVEGLDLYEQHVALELVDRIRDQEKFASEQKLVDAVAADVLAIRAILGG